MKKLLIFLLLFTFGFGAYCAETLVCSASGTNTTTANFGRKSAVNVYTIPTSGEYKIINTIDMPSNYYACVGYRDGSSCATIGGLTVNSSTVSREYTMSFVAGQIIVLYYPVGNATVSSSADIYQITVGPSPVNDPNDPAYDPTHPDSDPDDDGIPNKDDDDDDGDGIPDVDDPDPYDPNHDYDPVVPVPAPTDPYNPTDPISIPDIPTDTIPDEPIPDDPNPDEPYTPDKPFPEPDPDDDNIDNDDDVPIIKHFEETLMKDLEYWNMEKEIRDKKAFNRLGDLLELYMAMSNVWLNFVDRVTPDIETIKNTNISIDNNVQSINDKLTNISSVISLLDTNQTQQFENIKSVLEQQLAVQQNQLTTQQSQLTVHQNQLITQDNQLNVQHDQLITQNSILDLLDQIANPDPVLDLPVDNVADPNSPNLEFNLVNDTEIEPRELKKYEKEFPKIKNALRNRDGTLDLTLTLPFSKITNLMEDMVLNFGDSPYSLILSWFRVVISACLYYFTMLKWFTIVGSLGDK